MIGTPQNDVGWLTGIKTYRVESGVEYNFNLNRVELGMEYNFNLIIIV
jgi:hypothetical protein